MCFVFCLFSVIGVDTILQRTQEDLGRIKKTSYFQRNKKPETPTPSEEAKSVVAAPTSSTPGESQCQASGKATKWVGFEEGSRQQESEEAESKEQETVQAEEAPVQPAEEAIPEEEPEPEEEEDIFNTEYVDVVTSGELKLAYIPDDSPTTEAGDDPFDTSVVEKVVGPLPVIKKKKALVSIGSAVEVLTAANAAGAPLSSIRRRTVPVPTEIQLLGCLEDDDLPATSTPNSTTPLPPSSIPPTPQNQETTSTTPHIKDILAEFDVIPENIDVVEELVEKPAPAPPTPKEPELLDDEDFEFQALAYESVAKNPQLPPPEPEEEDDPFDTSSVEKVLKTNLVETVASSNSKSIPAQTETGSHSLPKTNLPPPRPRPVAAPARPQRPPAPVTAVPIDSVAVEVPTQQPTPSAQLQAQDSFDALFLNEDPSPCEPIRSEEKEVPANEEDDPFDTSAVDSLVINAIPEATLTVTSFELPPDQEEEDDPFDTSAVEKILN